MIILPTLPLSLIDNGHWQPGIGDPSFRGWITVIAYLVTAFLCSYCGQQQKRDRFQRALGDRWFWWIFSIILLLMGLNKQLDLQSWLTEVGKQVATDQGWYDQRRRVQLDFIMGLIVFSFATLMFLIQSMGKAWKKFWLALLGMLFLLCFIIIRATSFHHVDQLLGWELGGFSLNWILELGGITCIAIAAIREKSGVQKMRISKKGL